MRRRRMVKTRSSYSEQPLYNMKLREYCFQADDGIRDVAVTGVQTCALPICLAGEEGLVVVPRVADRFSVLLVSGRWVVSAGRSAVCRIRHTSTSRSEERRVGKEGSDAASSYG